MTQPVTVLGAGIVGVCSALSLAERGVAVRLIDRSAPGQETSFGNAGVISPWSFIPQAMPGIWKQVPRLMFTGAKPLSVHWREWPKMIPWGLRFLRNGREQTLWKNAEAMQVLCGPSVDMFRQHLAGTGHEHLVQDSMYVHAFRDGSRANLDSIDYVIRREKGADLGLISGAELRRLEPSLSEVFEAAVVIRDQARATSPGKIATVLADKARSLGAEFISDEIRALSPLEEGWELQGERQSYQSQKVIIALGAWSLQLLEPLGLRLPLMSERGYHVEFASPDVEINNSVMDVDAKFVASSMENGVRCAGLAEFASVDAPADQRKKQKLAKLAKAAFPDLNSEPTHFWMGRRPSFPDSLPVLGAVQDHEGLHVNFGHSHYGLMMAPKSGQIIADIVQGRVPNIDLSAYSPDRFQ